MPEGLITHLRHVDLATPDEDRARAFYTSTWGLREVDHSDGLTFLAAEGSPERYVVRLRRSDDKRLDLISFGARDGAAVDQLAERLARGGTHVVAAPGSQATPGGGYGLRFFDPDGRTVEVSAGVEARPHRAIEEGESIPVRLSHVVLNSPAPEALVAFYVDQLGFALSDTLMHPHMGEMMWFLRCNRYHHSLAVARGPHGSLHHASFELRGVDEFMRGGGRALRAGVERVWGPGRHLAGENAFQYFLDPFGNTVEYTTQLSTVDEDTWHPHLYDFTQPDVADQWGTANPIGPEVAMKSFNTPDPAFVAPPV